MEPQTPELWLKDHPEIQTALAAICDLNGMLRGKRIPIDQIDKLLEGGLRMPLSALGVDVWGEDIEGSDLVFQTGDADGLCDVTGRGVLPMSWVNHPTVLVPMWLSWENGDPFLGDPRRALQHITNRFAELGLTPVVATELEFYLVDPEPDIPEPPKSPVSGKQLDSDDVYSIDELQHFDDFLSDVFDACREQGIPADSAISENGAGQFEINMMHVPDPLRAADDAILFKRTVRGVARKHGMAATFMAKPYGNLSGNGFHVHFSLIDKDGNNVFDNGGPEGTEILRHAVAGLLKTMAQCTLTFAPHENSFRRLAPGAHAPSAIAWGYENRTVAVRVPGGSPKARRIEHRVAGADANPYLVLASILGGALLGIENKWEPEAPVSGNAYDQDLPRLPLDWASAIEAYRVGPHIPQIYSAQLQRMLTDCKRQELRVFKRRVTDFEYHTYLETV
ncbi:glutamine synthetase family protein [Celeribacter sp. SCSIO 80788]|uniref:glutamine synthetase family protein n=1 Tax=Celeribacter sp. SCSIO 80788 TaxID=3117013 RepID=UPI003DA5895A